jgi:hypothetical protein
MALARGKSGIKPTLVTAVTRISPVGSAIVAEISPPAKRLAICFAASSNVADESAVAAETVARICPCSPFSATKRRYAAVVM